MANYSNVSEIVEELKECSGEGDVSVGDVVSALKYRGYGPVLFVISLLTLMPTGAIPGVPTLTAVLIFFIAAQMLWGKKSPWIPQLLAKRHISHDSFTKACEKSESLSSKIDHIVGPRLTFMINPWSVRVIALICCAIAFSMPPLELLPFVAFVPAATIALLGLGLSVKDGLLIIIAFVWLIIGGLIAHQFV